MLLLHKRKSVRIHAITDSNTDIWSLLRIIWAIFIISAFLLLIYITITNLTTFFTYPKSVNVEVNYKSPLTFPAVTVCNYNSHRWVWKNIVFLLLPFQINDQGAIKMSSYQCMNFDLKNKIDSWQSFLYNRNSIPGKTVCILRQSRTFQYVARAWGLCEILS